MTFFEATIYEETITAMIFEKAVVSAVVEKFTSVTAPTTIPLEEHPVGDRTRRRRSCSSTP